MSITNSCPRTTSQHPLPAGQTRTRLLAPTVGTGVFMAAYLLLRPYGDADGGPAAVAAAFASWLWVAAHVLGMLAIASFARLAVRIADEQTAQAGRPRSWVPARIARWSALAGTVLVLPYYGAETFALHVIGKAALAGGATGVDVTTLALAEQVRNEPVAMAMFGLGLVLLAVAGLALAAAWAHRYPAATASIRFAAWPLGMLVALLLPQFYLPTSGRMAFGVLYALAAGYLLLAAHRQATAHDQ